VLSAWVLLCYRLEDCPVIVIKEDLYQVDGTCEPCCVQEEGTCLFVILLLLDGKRGHMLVSEHPGVCGEVGQGSVECHRSCCFHSCFEDGLGY
jgi:hypothetical protein